MKKHFLLLLLGLFLLGMPMGSALGAPYVYPFYDTDVATGQVPVESYIIPSGGAFTLTSVTSGTGFPPFFQVSDLSGAAMPLPMEDYVHQSFDDTPTALRIDFTQPSPTDMYLFSFDFAITDDPDIPALQPLNLSFYSSTGVLLSETAILPTLSSFGYMGADYYVGSWETTLGVGFDGYAILETENDYVDGEARYLFLDNMAYTPVPIPGTLGLLGLGLLGLGRRVRRQS